TSCGGGGGVFRSADAGMSWTDTGLAGCVSAIVIDPKTPSTLYASSGDPRTGVVKSTDGGTNWTAVNAGLPASTSWTPIALAIDPQTPSTLYAGVQTYFSGQWTAGLFKSANGGRTWTSTGLNQSVLGGVTFNLTIYPQDMDTVYVVTASYVGGGAL